MSDKDGKAIGQGSGFLVSDDGLIGTNYHVIAQGNSAVVKLPNGAFFVVDGVVASDKARDLAIIKAHGTDFRTLPLGNSDRVQVGEDVVAIGNPLSLESTVSNGIVSGIRTDDELGGKFLQITSPISHGSSGGPLFNMAGEVIGITTSGLEGGENLNFAIPVNDAKHLLLARSSRVAELPNENESARGQAPSTNVTELANAKWTQTEIDSEHNSVDKRELRIVGTSAPGFNAILTTTSDYRSGETVERDQWVEKLIFESTAVADTIQGYISECNATRNSNLTALNEQAPCSTQGRASLHMIDHDHIQLTWQDTQRTVKQFTLSRSF